MLFKDVHNFEFDGTPSNQDTIARIPQAAFRRSNLSRDAPAR